MRHCPWDCVCLDRALPSAGGLQEDKDACNWSSGKTWRAALFAAGAAAALTEEISCSCQLTKVNRSAATSWHRAWATSTNQSRDVHTRSSHTYVYLSRRAAEKTPLNMGVVHICVFSISNQLLLRGHCLHAGAAGTGMVVNCALSVHVLIKCSHWLIKCNLMEAWVQSESHRVRPVLLQSGLSELWSCAAFFKSASGLELRASFNILDNIF